MAKRYLRSFETGGTPAKLHCYSDAAESVFSAKPEDVQNETGFAKSHELRVQHDGTGYFVEIETPAVETALAGVLA